MADDTNNSMGMEEKQAPAGALSDEEETDLNIAVMMGERMLEEGGYDLLQKAVDQSSDPAQVIGQFFVQLIKKLDESMPTELRISPRVYLAKGGWLEQLMDKVIDELKLDVKIADRAEIFVADTVTKLGQAGQAQQAQGGDPSAGGPAPAAPAGAPPMPQGAA